MPLVPSSFPSWFRWTAGSAAASRLWPTTATTSASGLRTRPGRSAVAPWLWPTPAATPASGLRIGPGRSATATRPGSRRSKQAPPLYALHPSLRG